MGSVRAAVALAWVSLLVGCAQVSSPTGGPVDEDPPQILSIDPPAGSVQWEGGVVRFTFNEYIQVKNVREQWLLSPPLDRLPSYRLRGKVLELDWSEVTLPEGGTVVLDLGESVVDLHEGNPLVGGVWAAARGAELDTLVWRGQVIRRDFAAPAPGVRVMLFPAEWPADSLLQGARPQYVGVTDAQGRFEVGYVAPGRYRTWAVEDANKDWAWNPGESVGWAGTWTAGMDTVPALLTLFPSQAKSTAYPSPFTRDSTGLISGAINGPSTLEHLDWTTLDGRSVLHHEEGDSAWIWGTEADTLLWSWQTADERGMDTVAVRRAKARRSAAARRPLSGKQRATSTRLLSFDQPIAAVHPGFWRMGADSVEVGIDSLALASPFAVRLHAHEAHGVKYALAVDPGGVEFALGGVNDSVSTQWETWPADHLAELVIQVSGAHVDGRLKLEDATGRLLAERTLLAGDSVVWTVRDLMPGKVELVWESNRWGSGQFEEAEVAGFREGDVRLKAEGGVELRSNWTLEWIWSVNSGKFPKLEE